MTYNYKQSAGPAIWKDETGTWRAACLKKYSGGLIACVDYGGGACRSWKTAGRTVEDPSSAPEWCPYAAGMIEDVEFDERMRALGVNPYTKKGLLSVIRAMPKELRPRRARELSLRGMQQAINAAIAAGWEKQGND